MLRKRNPRHAAARRAGLALLVLIAALLGVRGVQAHAHYARSTPAIGQVLPSAPARVDIYTDQEMAKVGSANTIVVTGSSGQRVDSGDSTVDDGDRKHFSVGLQPNLPAGRYVVSFTTLSDADNDTDHGRFAFYIGAGPTAADRQLDAQLTGSATPVAGSSSHAGLIAGLAGAAALVLALAGGILLVRRRAPGHG